MWFQPDGAKNFYLRGKFEMNGMKTIWDSWRWTTWVGSWMKMGNDQTTRGKSVESRVHERSDGRVGSATLVTKDCRLQIEEICSESGTILQWKCFPGEKQCRNVGTSPLQDEKLKLERDWSNLKLKTLRNSVKLFGGKVQFSAKISLSKIGHPTSEWPTQSVTLKLGTHVH